MNPLLFVIRAICARVGHFYFAVVFFWAVVIGLACLMVTKGYNPAACLLAACIATVIFSLTRSDT